MAVPGWSGTLIPADATSTALASDELELSYGYIAGSWYINTTCKIYMYIYKNSLAVTVWPCKASPLTLYSTSDWLDVIFVQSYCVFFSFSTFHPTHFPPYPLQSLFPSHFWLLSRYNGSAKNTTDYIWGAVSFIKYSNFSVSWFRFPSRIRHGIACTSKAVFLACSFFNERTLCYLASSSHCHIKKIHYFWHTCPTCSEANKRQKKEQESKVQFMWSLVLFNCDVYRKHVSYKV